MAREPLRNFRCSEDLWRQLREDLDKHNQGPLNRWMTLSDWLRAAIRERLAQRSRSRNKRRRRKAKEVAT